MKDIRDADPGFSDANPDQEFNTRYGDPFEG